MRYAQIDKCECCNGNDVGVSIFVQGCPLRCPFCHNSSIWDFDGGTEYSQKTLQTIIRLIDKPYIKRFSILGGEPLLPQNYKDLYGLCAEIKKYRSDMNIWLWSGYYFDEIWVKARKDTTNYLFALLDYIDVLVDGPFVQKQKDITLKWRGSKNQHVIDLQKTINHANHHCTKPPQPILYYD